MFWLFFIYHDFCCVNIFYKKFLDKFLDKTVVQAAVYFLFVIYVSFICTLYTFINCF